MIADQQTGVYPAAQVQYAGFMGLGVIQSYLSAAASPPAGGAPLDNQIRFFLDRESFVSGGVTIGGS